MASLTSTSSNRTRCTSWPIVFGRPLGMCPHGCHFWPARATGGVLWLLLASAYSFIRPKGTETSEEPYVAPRVVSSQQLRKAMDCLLCSGGDVGQCVSTCFLCRNRLNIATTRHIYIGTVPIYRAAPPIHRYKVPI